MLEHPESEATAPSPRTHQAVNWRVPILGILGTSFFARGLLIPWLGFYWDDLPTLWAMHAYGQAVTWQFFRSDRPFLPWIYQLTAPLAGESPVRWQLLGLLAWFLAGVSVWWLMVGLWPSQRRLALLSGLLFVVYPGFLQGPISIIYSHFLFLSALFFFSFSCTVRAIRGGPRSQAWFAAALGTQALALFSFEYLVGLELLRPALIGLVLRQEGLRGRRWAVRTTLTWLPHLAILSVYLVWRAVTPRFPTYEPALLTMLAQQPGAALQALASRIASDLLLTTGGAWFEAASPPALSSIGKTGLLAMSVSFLGAALVTVWALLRQRPNDLGKPSPAARTDLAAAAGLGAWALLIAGIPVWIPMLPLQLSFSWDRMTLPFILGASVLAASLLVMAFGRWRASVALFAAVVALGAAHLTGNAVSYMQDWRELRTFLSQLTTRAPGLAPGTTLLTNDFPLDYYSDNSLTAPLNWAYAPDLDSTTIPYMLYYVSIRLGLGLPALEPGLPITQRYRPGTFEGSTSQTLAVYFEPPGCLQILDVELHDSMPGLSAGLSQAVPLSNLGLIDPSPEIPARSPFAEAIEANWCIYFERADLARQQSNWSEVAAIGDHALLLEDRPNNVSEYLPFVEAYGHVDRWEDALHWTGVAMERNSEVRRMVCNTWGRLIHTTPASSEKEQALAELPSLVRCEP
ncbi:MAG: hypothetical protein MUO23_02515 [Anaerolineales bacterium]|nr:hypothetical protein [Anaerolineales bacterium]